MAIYPFYGVEFNLQAKFLFSFRYSGMINNFTKLLMRERQSLRLFAFQITSFNNEYKYSNNRMH